MLQVTALFPEFDRLQAIHGSPELRSIYGAGQIVNPKVCLVFMNPTAKNVSAHSGWTGIQAPWLGTKNVWRLLHQLGLFSHAEIISQTQSLTPVQWTPEFAEKLYSELATHSIYITNIAKCTQEDARPLNNEVYREYLPTMLKELDIVMPKHVFTLGNQVSSVVLNRPLSVSDYLNDEYETLVTSNSTFKIYPTYYPVGQGTPNMPKAVSRIKRVLGD